MVKFFRKLLICLLLAAMVGTMIPTAHAQSTFNSYTYDEWDESQKAPASYEPVLVRNGMEVGTGSWKTPSDFFMDDDGMLYVADTGNERILVLNEDLELQTVMETVTMNGEEIPLTDVQGLYVSDEGVIYACQTSLARILLIRDGAVIDTIERPVSSLIPEDFSFAPTKVGIDVYGRAFVLSKGCYSGLLQYDLDGSFMGFFGANKVEVTAEVLFSYMWKSILSDEQRAAMTSILPMLLDHQESHRQAELDSRQCLSGPHKDDLTVEIDGNLAKSFASQGQTRTAALSLKLAAREIFQQDTGEYPVLLLDDVLSELDPKRQEFVLNRIQGGQVFITCCEDDRLDQMLGGKVLQIRDGKLV